MSTDYQSNDDKMEEVDEEGSIADFIDRTILRCLIDYETNVKDNPANEEAGNHPQHQAEDVNWAMGHPSRALELCMQERKNQVGKCPRLSQDVEERKSQSLQYHQLGAIRNKVYCEVPSRTLSELSNQGLVETETRDNTQLPLSVSESCRSRSVPSPPSNEQQSLPVPDHSSLGQTSTSRHLCVEEVCRRQGICEPVKKFLLKTRNNNGSFDISLRNASCSLPSQSVPLDLTCTKSATSLRNVSSKTACSHSLVITGESSKADSVEKIEHPSLRGSFEGDCDITNTQECSSCMGRVIRELGLSSDVDSPKINSSGHSVVDSTSSLKGCETNSTVRIPENDDNDEGKVVPQQAHTDLVVGTSPDNESSVHAASSVCHGCVCGPASSAVESEGNVGQSARSGLDDGVQNDMVVPRRVQSEHKATDKVKKRFQKRYFEGEAEAADRAKKATESKGQKRHHEEEPEKETSSGTTALETFNLENDAGRVSNWRVKKWKKQRLEAAEEAAESGSKSQKSKRKPGIKGKQKRSFKGKQTKNMKTGKKTSKLDIMEEPGFIEYGSDEEDERLTQTEIAEAVDVTSATKYFELNLPDFGPYSINYSRNGRHLLLGGEKGHVAAFEWQTKKLSFEMNTERTSCVQWLHQETMLAAAHPSSVCVYDNLGIELHALTDLDSVLRMEFLPHHMLLVTANEKGFLGYTDVSMGTRVGSICTGLGRLDVMTHNPANAVVYLGHAAGTVTLWSPTVKKPLVKMLTHKAPVRALAIDSTGNYLATSGVDKRVKVFDLRTCKMLHKVQVPMGASSLDFSHQGLLAAAMGNRVQIYKDCRGSVVMPYLSHVTNSSLRNVQFCPFEDVLGAGHQRGFSSLIVPGSGNASIDALSVNPLATRKQRQNMEVRLLLDKLQPEMIGLTNWLWDMESGSQKSGAQKSGAQKSGAQKVPQTPGKKLGNKQKEELQREKTRASLTQKKKTKGTNSNPLSRFQKS